MVAPHEPFIAVCGTLAAMSMTDEYRVIRVKDIADLEKELNDLAAAGFQWVAQIQAGNHPAIVMKREGSAQSVNAGKPD